MLNAEYAYCIHFNLQGKCFNFIQPEKEFHYLSGCFIVLNNHPSYLLKQFYTSWSHLWYLVCSTTSEKHDKNAHRWRATISQNVSGISPIAMENFNKVKYLFIFTCEQSWPGIKIHFPNLKYNLVHLLCTECSQMLFEASFTCPFCGMLQGCEPEPLILYLWLCYGWIIFNHNFLRSQINSKPAALFKSAATAVWKPSSLPLTSSGSIDPVTSPVSFAPITPIESPLLFWLDLAPTNEELAWWCWPHKDVNVLWVILWCWAEQGGGTFPSGSQRYPWPAITGPFPA